MKYKSIKAWSVIHLDKECSLNPTIMDYIFSTKEKAKSFAGSNKVDIVKILITPIK